MSNNTAETIPLITATRFDDLKAVRTTGEANNDYSDTASHEAINTAGKGLANNYAKIIFLLLIHSANATEPITTPPIATPQPEINWTPVILALLICVLIVFIGQFATSTGGGPSVSAGGSGGGGGWTGPTLGH